eukprot:2702127-Prymnesium_polylepis.1
MLWGVSGGEGEGRRVEWGARAAVKLVQVGHPPLEAAPLCSQLVDRVSERRPRRLLLLRHRQRILRVICSGSRGVRYATARCGEGGVRFVQCATSRRLRFDPRAWRRGGKGSQKGFAVRGPVNEG